VSTPIHQEVVFKASPDRIYEALMDARQHGAFTGSPAEISRDAGGPFSCHGGQIVGRNIELVRNQRIVQAWRVASWADGVYSIVKFELQRHGSETRLVLDHSSFPEDEKPHLESGWHARYWEPLRKYLT
jgi:activator of HSP90 ATPase